MESVRLLNMAVFGLSLRTLNQIKGMVEIILPEAVKVNWTNITHPDLNILLINDMFLESSNIQRLIQNKEMKVLKLVAEQKVATTKIHNDIFSLREMDQNLLKDWLLNNINTIEKPVGCRQKASNNYLDKHVNHMHRSLEKASLESVKKIFNSANGRIKIFDRFGELAICDTRMQWAWVNIDRANQFTDLSLNYTHATTGDLKQPAMKQQHLSLWMWKIFWNSTDYLALAPHQGYFKLIRWPQPELNNEHREILKIATCFSMGAEINEVAKHLELSPSMVRQFIAASLALGFVESIPSVEAKFKIQEEVSKPIEVGKVKSFFSRLRAKLGL